MHEPSSSEPRSSSQAHDTALGRPVRVPAPADDSGVVVPIRAVGEHRAGLAPWLALLLVLTPFARIVAHLTADSGWSPTALIVDLALLVAVATALVPPARLRRSEGTATFTEAGMHVRFDGLLSRAWFVPASDIASVKVTREGDAASHAPVLGLARRDANVLVTFVERAPEIPVKVGFLPASLLGNWGRHGGVPAPRATLQAVGWYTGAASDALADEITAALGGVRPETR